jgi:hypothetical protein
MRPKLSTTAKTKACSGEIRVFVCLFAVIVDAPSGAFPY